MEQGNQSLSEQTLALWDQAVAAAANLLLPTRLTQVAILLAILLVAFIARRTLAPRLYDWMRTLEGWPKWRLRVLKRFGMNLNREGFP